MRLSITTTGRYEPTCFDHTGQEEASRPCVEYKLLTGEQVEAIQSSRDNDAWARIWKSQVTRLSDVVFEIDGVEKQVPIREIPDLPGTYLLIYEVSNHILSESILGRDAKKKLP
ncbi:hypothetical protein [Sphaerochaeta sp.]|uniref:hypothetical protein n=1 Tax=Sphaerochaeta sp. TaxID=1972642 RepID=UPI003D0F2C0A